MAPGAPGWPGTGPPRRVNADGAEISPGGLIFVRCWSETDPNLAKTAKPGMRKNSVFTDAPYFWKPFPAEKLDWCCDRFDVYKARDGSKKLRLAELVPMKPESAREVP